VYSVRSKTNDPKFLELGFDSEVLPVVMNRIAFIVLREDKRVEATYELLVSMAQFFDGNRAGGVVWILESVDDSVGERGDASNVSDSGSIECLEKRRIRFLTESIGHDELKICIGRHATSSMWMHSLGWGFGIAVLTSESTTSEGE
jgi:hypothetical protein